MILRDERSPVPPKITSAQGPGVRPRRWPARSGLAVAVAMLTRSCSISGLRPETRSRLVVFAPRSISGLRPETRSRLVVFAPRGEAARRSFRCGDAARRSFGLHLMAAELVAEGGGDLQRESVLLARGEAREQRMGERGHRHAVIDRLMDRPAPLAGVLDVALDPLELVALGLERALGELEQPRTDHAAVVPDPGDGLEVDVELARVDELEPLAVRLHHPVLDAVVDHLREVAGAALAEVRPTVRRRERVEQRPDDLDGVGRTPDHHAVADLEAPDPAGDADVEVPEAARAVAFGAPHRIAEVRVPAVDEYVTWARVGREALERFVGRRARRDHRPQDPRRAELRDELLDRVRPDRAGRDRLVDRAGAAVRRDDAMTAARQPDGHVAAHSPEAIDTDLHIRTPNAPVPARPELMRAAPLADIVSDGPRQALCCGHVAPPRGRSTGRKG